MFCSKCGEKITDGSAFCQNCGAALFSNGNSEPAKSPLMESVSFTEKPEREQTTINMHQKMGWTLKSSQEINTSSANSAKEHYIKLVFLRDKNMPNYDILKEKYESFTRIAGQIAALEASVEKRAKKFYFFFAFLIPCIAAFLGTALFMKIMHDDYVVYDFLTVCLYGVFFMGIYAVAFCIVFPISSKVSEYRNKKKALPKIAEAYRQMGVIANEAEKYM